MNVVILEDEVLAVEGLRSQLRRCDPGIRVLAELDSVKTAVAWFQNNPAPDLAFFDIQLGDGLSFEVFEQVKITCPVVFTTAYDAYSLRAFKVNSIDYLLKPVSLEALQQAFDKLRTLRGAPVAVPDLNTIRQLLHRTTPAFKERFMVKVGDNLAAFTTDEIDFFFGENKIVWMRLKNGRKYVVDYTLEELEDLVDPKLFFRLNRKYLCTFDAIKTTTAYSNSRLKVVLKDPVDAEEVLVSREKAEAFRVWLGK
jgi:DNA-binding LytR/AlgR family response regulator